MIVMERTTAMPIAVVVAEMVMAVKHPRQALLSLQLHILCIN